MPWWRRFRCVTEPPETRGDVNWRLIEGTARPGRDYGGPKAASNHSSRGNSFRILYVRSGKPGLAA